VVAIRSNIGQSIVYPVLQISKTLGNRLFEIIKVRSRRRFEDMNSLQQRTFPKWSCSCGFEEVNFKNKNGSISNY
jgi:hypothetical protein